MFESNSLRFFVTLSILTSGCQRSHRGFEEHQTVYINQAEAVRVNETHFKWHQQAEGGLYSTEPNVVSYVEKVGKRMARLSAYPNLPYEFVVTHQGSPHAIALLSGKIAINRGLLVALENEAELAAILAQNIALSPILYRSQQTKIQNIFRIPIESLRECFFKGFNYSPLSVETELELDRKAIQSLVLAGYDPKALLGVHEKLKRLKEVMPAHRGLSIHPYSDERIAAASQTIASYPSGGYLGKSPYQQALKPLKRVEKSYKLLSDSEDRFASGEFEAALKLIDLAIDVEPLESRFHLIRGQILRELGSLDSALKAFNRSIQLYPDYYKTYEERALLYMKMDAFVEAKGDFEKSLSLFPSCESLEKNLTLPPEKVSTE